jgi:hypothetical protein
MTIDIRGDGDYSRLCPPTASISCERTLEACEQISREMHEHFDQVAAENPDARAVADAIAHPAPGLSTITISKEFGADISDPDDVYRRILEVNDEFSRSGTH